MRRYFSLVGVPSLAPAVAMAKAEAADRALRLLSSSRHEDMTVPLLYENRENSGRRTTAHTSRFTEICSFLASDKYIFEHLPPRFANLNPPATFLATTRSTRSAHQGRMCKQCQNVKF